MDNTLNLFLQRLCEFTFIHRLQYFKEVTLWVKLDKLKGIQDINGIILY